MFSEQLLGAVQEETVKFIKGVQRLTGPLTRNGKGFRNVRFETGTQLGRDGAWTISLADKLVATFPELQTPQHARLALEMIAALPGAEIGFSVARQWDREKQARGAVVLSRSNEVRHEVYLRTARTGGVDPTDESVKPAEKPAPVDPTAVVAEPEKSNLGI